MRGLVCLLVAAALGASEAIVLRHHADREGLDEGSASGASLADSLDTDSSASGDSGASVATVTVSKSSSGSGSGSGSDQGTPMVHSLALAQQKDMDGLATASKTNYEQIQKMLVELQDKHKKQADELNVQLQQIGSKKTFTPVAEPESIDPGKARLEKLGMHLNQVESKLTELLEASSSSGSGSGNGSGSGSGSGTAEGTVAEGAVAEGKAAEGTAAEPAKATNGEAPAAGAAAEAAAVAAEEGMAPPVAAPAGPSPPSKAELAAAAAAAAAAEGGGAGGVPTLFPGVKSYPAMVTGDDDPADPIFHSQGKKKKVALALDDKMAIDLKVLKQAEGILNKATPDIEAGRQGVEEDVKAMGMEIPWAKEEEEEESASENA